MAENMTQPTPQSPADFVATVQPERRRQDAEALMTFFQRVTGWDAVMWGSAMIGYGRYHYRYESGREGDYLATGFSPRRSTLSIYIMPGYADFDGILARLGKHKMGKSCLYVTRLDHVDMDVLEELVRAGLENLERQYPVFPR